MQEQKSLTQLSLFAPDESPKPKESRARDQAADPVFAAFRVKDNPFAQVTTLDELKQLMQGCSRCSLYQHRTNIVFGEGDPEARVMLVGEGPGAYEDETGRPFVGAAGQLLDRILAAADFRREEVFIGNVVKCRPPGNRLPETAEAATCLPYLLTQIRIIRPKIIVCLGALSTQILVDSKARITAVRGAWYEKAGIKIMPTFHPAALLRDVSKKKSVWEDFQRIRAEYDLGW
jgi:DNA polymerase